MLVKDGEVGHFVLRQFCDVSSIAFFLAREERQAGVCQCNELLVLRTASKHKMHSAQKVLKIEGYILTELLFCDFPPKVL